MEALFAAVRRCCAARVWSRGVELARRDAVIGQRADGEELVLKVALPGQRLAPTVMLWPADEEWSCDCKAFDGEIPCEHIAAAVIALRRGHQRGEALPQPAVGGLRLAYRFQRTGRKLQFCRMLLEDGRETVFRQSLLAPTGKPLAPSAADLGVERALGAGHAGWISSSRMALLLEALAESGLEVTLDGQPISVLSDPPEIRGHLVDDPGGLRLYVTQDASIDEVFENGAVRCGNVLRPLGDSPLTEEELATLPTGRVFAEAQWAELVAERLPSLQQRIPVEVRTRRLPATTGMKVRPALFTHGAGERLTVEATAVYGDPPVARVDGERLVTLDARGALPLRDRFAEERTIRRLEQDLDLRSGRPTHLLGVEAVRFVEGLDRDGLALLGEGHRAFARRAPLRPVVGTAEGALDLRFVSEGVEADAEAVLRAWQAGEGLVPLLSGGWAALPRDWLERHGQRVADLLAARREGRGALPAAARLDLVALCDELERPVPPELAPLRALLESPGAAGTAELEPAALPCDLAAELRPYQRVGVDWLCSLRRLGLGALLADDMGLGKTLQALCALEGRTLVVAPTSVVHGWAGEIARFRPALRCALYHGAGRALDPAADVTLTSYAILRRDVEQLAAVDWGTVVLDEAQAMKNPESQTAQACYRLRAAFRVALTGTPVENRLGDLWSQMHFLNRGLLGGRHDFEQRYAAPLAAGDAAVAAHLRRRIAPLLRRRRKQQVAAELPPRIEVTLHCELDARERAVYDAVGAATRAEVLARLEAGGSVIAVLEALLRLRQAACDSALVPGQPDQGQSSKVALLCETLEQVIAEGHKALVFSQWTSLLDRIEPALGAMGVALCRLDGSTRDRGAVVSRFQQADGPPVMLISLKAGGVGLNLTEADHVFLLDPWWNPATEDQAADRAHRIGQTRPVIVQRLIARETVEQRIVELQQRKRAVAAAVLDGAASAGALTREDLLALLD